MADSRWFPSSKQLQDPKALEKSFRQLLTQHYDLQDRFNRMQKEKDKPKVDDGTPPPGSGPTDTQICGIRVHPVDTQILADGAKLTYVKASGIFKFQ